MGAGCAGTSGRPLCGGNDDFWLRLIDSRRIDEYTILVTADHGGHDRGHGSEMPEDMTIPQFYLGKEFEPGKVFTNVSLLDLAPTAATLLQVAIPREWEGTSLVG